MQHRVYFDNASTSNINPEIYETYCRLLKENYANSESLYEEGSSINRMMEKARSAIAGLLEVSPDEIIFTSGSCESNTSAIKGVSLALPEKKHIITTAVEHSSIMNACSQMEKLFGYRVSYLPVDQSGKIRISDLIEELDEDTALVSIMMVNNESGAINPIAEAGEYIKKHSHAYFHTDMTQAAGKLPLSMNNIDLASISAHKIEGLKGSGILIKKRHVPFVPLICGGEQESGMRGGTSNAVVNAMLAKTLRLAEEGRIQNHDRIAQMHDHLIEKLQEIPGIELNSPTDSVDSIINFSYEKIPSEVMQNALNQKGFMVSARSTCDSHSVNPSYVLTAMGYSTRRASCCIRVSLSARNTIPETDAFICALKEIIEHYG